MFYALGKVIELALTFCLLIIFAKVILSWVNPDSSNQIARRMIRFINNTTEPVLLWIRKSIPVVWAGFDFSPVLVIFVIYFLLHLVERILL